MPGADSQCAVGAGEDDGVGFDVLDDFPAELTAIETSTEIEDIDSLFSDSLISTVETSKQPEDQPAIITPDEIEPQIHCLARWRQRYFCHTG